MTSHQSNEPKFGDWFREQREEYELSPEDAAQWLDISVSTIMRWESGHIHWNQLPKNLKQQIQEKFGAFLPTNEQLTLNRPATKAEDPTTQTSFLEDLQQDLKKFNLLDRSKPSAQPNDPGEFPECPCSKCGFLIRFKDNGRCPKCKRAFDQGH